ncbi:hypothetical protein JHK87_002637 [Glycine soja]|nr:hypothetical protein JHK87_002637 [Glycine soja]
MLSVREQWGTLRLLLFFLVFFKEGHRIVQACCQRLIKVLVSVNEVMGYVAQKKKNKVNEAKQKSTVWDGGSATLSYEKFALSSLDFQSMALHGSIYIHIQLLSFCKIN